jgi:hypothetical protein
MIYVSGFGFVDDDVDDEVLVSVNFIVKSYFDDDDVSISVTG